MKKGKIIAGLLIGAAAITGGILLYKGTQTSGDKPKEGDDKKLPDAITEPEKIKVVLPPVTPPPPNPIIGKEATAKQDVIAVKFGVRQADGTFTKAKSRKIPKGQFVGIVADDRGMLGAYPAFTLKGTGEMVIKSSVSLKDAPVYSFAGEDLESHSSFDSAELESNAASCDGIHSAQWCRVHYGNA